MAVRGTNVDHPVVEMLVQAYPDAVSCKSPDYNLPLHLACAGGASNEVIRALLQGSHGRDAAKKRGGSCMSSQGSIPLFLAVTNGASLQVVQALLAAFPKGAMSMERSSLRLPIHAAIDAGASDEVQETLIQAFPPDSSWEVFQLLWAQHHGDAALAAKVAADPSCVFELGERDATQLARWRTRQLSSSDHEPWTVSAT